MASGITLSAGVRQNLLSLQNTASMMASTQNRLATGKKVNSALDNPSNFFTSQSLADRAGDLNGLLDSIGQATKTLDAANNGITSLTKLVQSAKSIAQQARSATGATETFSSVGSSASILGASNLNGAETTATTTGVNTSALGNVLEAKSISKTGAAFAAETVATTTSTTNAEPAAISVTGTNLSAVETMGTVTSAGVDLSGGITAAAGQAGAVTFTANIRGQNVTYTATLTDGMTQAQVETALDGAQGPGGAGDTLSDFFNVTDTGTGFSFTALSSENDLTIVASSQTAALGFTTNAATNATLNSTSLVDAMSAANGSSVQGQNITIASTNAIGTANATQTITFGTGAGQVNTLADLNTRLANAGTISGGFTGSVTGGAITLAQSTPGNKTSITVGAGTLGTAAQAFIGGTGASSIFTTHNSQKTLADSAKAMSPTVDLSGGGSLGIKLNGGATVSVALAATDRLDDVITKINANSTLNTKIVASKDTSGGHEKLKIDGLDASSDITVVASDTSKALGLTTNASTDTQANANSVLNQLKAAGAQNGDTMTFGGTKPDGTTFNSTITFGTANGQVRTLSDLNSQLGTAAAASGGAFTASVNGSRQITFSMAANDKASVTIGGTVGTVGTAAVAIEGATAGNLFATHNSQATLADLGKTTTTPSLSTGGSLSFNINNKNYTVGLAATDRVDDVISKLNASAAATGLTFSKDTDATGNDHIKVDAKDASVDFTINANDTSKALGLTSTTGPVALSNTASNQQNSTSLLDLVGSAFGSPGLGQGKTLTIKANGGKEQTITFGTGSNQVQTLKDLNTKLGELSGVTASVSDTGALEINVASGDKQTSLEIGGTAAGKLGLATGEQKGEVISTTANQTRANLQNDYNDVLKQIDTLTKDASYNGINLLNGDDLKVTFNENGSSSLTIKGVTFDSNNLGMQGVKGDTFQDNEQIDSRIASIDSALADLRSQGSKFGSNLSTVQTRQEFTKNMINTLQTGSDALVLADTNEEGANLLALQTRQQLSTTALSMSSQQDQAVLRLF